MGRILVIEDDLGNQLLYQSRLRDLGHDVVMSSNGAQGIAEARTGAYDLYLVDMHLGEGVDGIEVCRRLKRDPETRNVPVVLISTKIRNRADLHRGYEAGCEAFLIKNDPTLVEDVVRAMLRIKALQDELASQMSLLQQRNERLQQALQDNADLEDQLKRHDGNGGAPGRTLLPDAVLLVDAEGTVVSTDRGAREIFARRVEGKSLGSLAPGTRLEAFVRDARSASHLGFRFVIPARGRHASQSLVACAYPVVPQNVGAETDLRVVLLYDELRQALLGEVLRAGTGALVPEEVGALVEIARREFVPGRLLGESAATVEARRRAAELALTDDPVLLTGEVGTGKEHVARVLHFSGERTGAFVPVACGDPSRSVEETLLGDGDPIGLVHRAHRGTLYLSEVDDLPRQTQERVLEALGGEVALPGTGGRGRLDVRLAVSTRRGEGRGDLAPALVERLGENRIDLPPLRERPEDLPALVRAFLERYARGEGAELSAECWTALESYDWPANVQELEAVIRGACAAAGEASTIEVGHLPPPLPDVHGELDARGRVTPTRRRAEPVPGTHQPETASSSSADGSLPRDVIQAMPDLPGEGIPVSFEFFEEWALNLALARSEGDKLRAARLLHVGKSTLYRKLHKFED